MCVRCLHHRTKHHSQWLHLIDNADLTAPRDHRFPSGCRPGCVLTWRLDWGSTPRSPAPAGCCRIHVLRPQDACWPLLEASDLGGAHPTPQQISASWYLMVTRTCAGSPGWKQVHFLPNQGEGRPQRVDARGRSEATLGSDPTVTGCHLLQGRLPFPDPAVSQPVLGSWRLS